MQLRLNRKQLYCKEKVAGAMRDSFMQQRCTACALKSGIVAPRLVKHV